MKKKLRISLSNTQVVMLSFLFVILIGSVLLVLPISTKSGVSVSYVDALFTATTATCVTGLVTQVTANTWSVFGQIVILILIQIGGLGVITIMAGLMLALHKKFQYKDSLLIGDSLNLNSLSGLGTFLKKVFIGTIIVEGVGALLYMIVFIPDYGAKGIWISIFNSVSAFCNAGMDIIGENSLCEYASNPLVNIITSLLIIFGGLGYIVWWDVIRVLKEFKKLKFKCLNKLTLHTKIVLSATAVLILVGMISIMIFEYENPLTLKDCSFFDKLQISFFQSVTTRTAGFASIPQENLTSSTSILSIFLMFIGGSPIGTAGGVKTTTIVVLMAIAYSMIKNKREVSIFHRNLTQQITRKAVAVVCMSFGIMFLSTIFLGLATPNASALDVFYESASATATVGLSRNLTGKLNVWGKVIIILTMYFGRVGPISLAIAFRSRKETNNNIKNPTEEINVG